ncbi:hypothetical protein BN1325_210045 [Staphylococcus aureus]|nr:hypothetical protein BN1325_210045 [Staphylococcus aureus]CRI29798.1 hypothetical protein BN1325_210045 [Staphylococcus aureus]
MHLNEVVTYLSAFVIGGYTNDAATK